MLEGMAQIDWAHLTHAYGPATDVPEHIRALHSADVKARKNAVSSLANTIFHQQDRYRASASAVPFLFEVLEAPDTQDRANIIELLMLLATGYMEYHLPFGFDASEEFEELVALDEEERADIRAEEPSEEDEWNRNVWLCGNGMRIRRCCGKWTFYSA